MLPPSPARLRYARRSGLLRRLRRHVVRQQMLLQLLEPMFCRIDPAEQIQVRIGYGAPFRERLEVEYFVPVLVAVQDDQQLLRELLRLRQREDLEHLVERAEPAGKN